MKPKKKFTGDVSVVVNAYAYIGGNKREVFDFNKPDAHVKFERKFKYFFKNVKDGEAKYKELEGKYFSPKVKSSDSKAAKPDNGLKEDS